MPYKNIEIRNDKSKEYSAKARKRNKIFIQKYKENKACILCGWNEHPQILVFHHVNPKNKRREVSLMASLCLSLENIKEEIKKCILLCPNCHEWFHHTEHVKLRKQKLGY